MRAVPTRQAHLGGAQLHRPDHGQGRLRSFVGQAEHLRVRPRAGHTSKPISPVRRGEATLLQQPSSVVARVASLDAPALPAAPDARQRRVRRWIPVVVGACVFVAWAMTVAQCGGSGSALPFASVSGSAGATAHHGLSLPAKSAWAGLLAGVLHTLAGPDHLAALTPLTIGRDRFKASLLGALWGWGHSCGQLILGLAFALLKDRIEGFMPALTKYSGTLVGLILVAIGVMGIYESFFEGDHHHHHHDEPMEVGPDGTVALKERKFGFATFITGIVYGLQPDALFVIIPALALPTKLAAVAYIIMFVTGTVAAMGGYTFAIGTATDSLKKSNPWILKHLSTIAATIAITVGVAVMLSGWGIVEVPGFG
ncbi:unnamed protein product [Pedinophyceae sp. YPF-701]|nr:unnamed protein product [Pedinophyceae sp. YPF-701]